MIGRRRRMIRRMRRRTIRRTVLVGGMVVLAASGASKAMKLSKADAQKIEEHTGQPPEQLEDQDLEAALQELSIQPQPLSPEDEAALRGQAPPGTVAPTPAPAPANAAAPSGQRDYLSEIQELARLKDAGIISQEEFEAKKKQLLGI